MTERDSNDALARGLGWFSLALGIAQLAAPKRLARLVGVRADGAHGAAIRLVGARELATGIGLLRRRRPAGWAWARVLGDALDLGLLAAAGSKRRRRVAAAAAAVAGVTVPDVIEGTRLSRRSRAPQTVTKAVTVNKPAQDVYDAWRDLENLPSFMTHLESVVTLDDVRSRWQATGPAGRTIEWEAELVEDRPAELISWRSLPGADVANSGTVRFRDAPGGRGTEVVVELDYAPPGGGAGVTLAKLFGEEPATQLADDLRRFKQVVETGELARSEGVPGGHSLRGQLKQQPARPVEAENGGRP